MYESKTKKSTRIIILAVAFVMAAGFLISYFLIIVEQNNPSTPQTQEEKANEEVQKKQTVDPTAYKVNGKVTKLETLDKKVGTGPAATANDTVRVHYKGTFAQSGIKFESSYDTGEPVAIPLGQVIPGWKEGIPGMQVGGQRRLVVPSDMAYGPSGRPGIPPNSDLVFEVELLAINPAQ